MKNIIENKVVEEQTPCHLMLQMVIVILVLITISFDENKNMYLYCVDFYLNQIIWINSR